MSHDEAKNVLKLYRPGGADAEDPQMAEALALAREDAELSRWLEQHCARQQDVRQQFRKITAPAGLLEQIVSEQQAREKAVYWRQSALQLAAVAVLAILIGLPFWLRPHPKNYPNSLAGYETAMAAVALRNYGMITVADPDQIRSFLKQAAAPADYVLPPALEKAALAGYAVENWEGKSISMICFRTGRPLTDGQQSDMWLFVADQTAVKDPPANTTPQFTQISRLAAASWNLNGKIYFLGTTADPAMLRKFL